MGVQFTMPFKPRPAVLVELVCNTKAAGNGTDISSNYLLATIVLWPVLCEGGEVCLRRRHVVGPFTISLVSKAHASPVTYYSKYHIHPCPESEHLAAVVISTSTTLTIRLASTTVYLPSQCSRQHCCNILKMSLSLLAWTFLPGVCNKPLP